MTNLFAARSQMALSLAFHIIFAVIGIGMPLLMVLAEWRWLRTRDTTYRTLARQWAKGTAILFAVGAVSGTVLSFELGLLWPGFMAKAGPIIGMPFSLEGFAFFIEAIFLAIYLYGWDRVSERAHFLAGIVVAVSGLSSAAFVMAVNSWMNAPVGFVLDNGRLVGIDPIAAMLNPAWPTLTLHMVLASYAATGFGVAGVHALRLRRAPSAFHRAALGLALLMAAPAAILQPVSGDIAARMDARRQPAKLAAMEGLFQTQRGAPLLLGGVPDAESRTVPGSIAIPKGLSLLAFHDPNAEVTGLDRVPRDQWPPLAPVRIAWQLMVALGSWLAFVAVVAGWRLLRHIPPERDRWWLTAIALSAPLGFVALEAGWVVTEVGRQPWVIYGVLRTADVVTPMPGLAVPLVMFTLLYLWLFGVVAFLLKRMVMSEPEAA
ncbi:MAG TPA: cytochrome ubiquinol oxidase subunit I [Gemmatimonadales bacterium]